MTFATGTPVSNSMVELYTIMRYLQYDTIQKMGLGHFDSWAAAFGETVTAIDTEQKLETLHQQLATAKEEVAKPFPKEQELAEKTDRLAELNALLNMDEKGTSETLGMDEAAEVADLPRKAVTYAGRVSEASQNADSLHRASVLGKLKAAQKQLAGKQSGRQKPERKQEQQL